MKRLVPILVAVVLVLVPATAFAGSPANPSCWGAVTSQRAVSEGDLGQHSSSQDTPRLGLGNVARLLFDLGVSTGPHVSDLGTALASIDGLESTSCP
ncbi:MAG TPA: hypothetical protein VK977_02410 [Actinomycetota bacterium]|nr:hypothetical protein [Actinomycetota bacterium]